MIICMHMHGRVHVDMHSYLPKPVEKLYSKVVARDLMLAMWYFLPQC